MEDNTSSTISINQLLSDAALQGEVSALQDLIQRDPLLVCRSSTPTSLHVACKLGHLQFAWELLRLNPSLSEELDPNDKSSPLHVASRNGHLEVVRSLVSINPSMCFARDLHGMNPAHVAVVKGHLHVLHELMIAVPPVARERVGVVGCGGGGESMLHLCLKYNRVEAVRMVVSAAGDSETLNATDGEGNTVLHVAVANKQLEIVRFLLNDRRVKKNTPNSNGLTAMDIFKQSYKNVTIDNQLKWTLKRFKVLPSEDIKKEKEKHHYFDWLENQRSVLMVVASLIATMAFQAGLNPPGGSWQDTDNVHIAGAAIMAQRNKRYYTIFLALNTTGLVASMSSILFLISGLPFRKFFVAFIMVTMWVAITAMTSAYGISLYALMPKEDQKLVNKVITYGLFAWLFVMGILLLGHVTWWTMRFLRQLGRLAKKIFQCCCPIRRIA